MKNALADICLLLCLAVAATAHGAPGDERYASPGRLEYAGGTELNFYCMGSGSPTVVFDAGWEDWSPTWATIQPPPIPASEDPPAPNMPCSHQFFRSLPMKEWSPGLNATVLHIANTRAALYDAVIAEMQEMPADAKWLERHRRSFGARPVRVLTAQNHFDDNDKTRPSVHSRHVAYEQGWARTQRRLLSLSTDSKQILVPDSDHYIQFDQPKVVIDAIVGELQERTRRR
jgi:pimeloyl-ACP methyl ester carboxylesterase